MRRASLIAGIALTFVVCGVALAHAAVDGADPTLWTRAILWIFDQQRQLHRELASQLRALADGAGWSTALAMIVGSFLYGVFHAAGPGHGKAVISTYLMTHQETIARGLTLSVISSGLQGLVAIVLVYGLIYGAGWLPADAKSAVVWSERLSFLMLMLIGVALGVRAVGRIRAARQGDHGSHHRGHDHHSHAHSCCDHGPTAEQIERARGFRATLGVLASISLRPCSGAVLVLVLAKVLTLPFAGVAAVLAMSAGTAVAVGGLAAFTVLARSWAAALTSLDRHTRWLALVGLAGGLIIAAMGMSLLIDSFGPGHPLGL